MTPQEKVARLEDLLARVRERAAAPRQSNATSEARPVASPPVVAARPAPPPPPEEVRVATSMPPLDDSEIDVEVSVEVVEVDIDIDEPTLAGAESGAHPVTEPVASRRESDDDLPAAEVSASEITLSEPSQPSIEGPSSASVTTAPPANELVEPEPSSSPRPIALDEPEPYVTESAPRLTPPPESGKQVAAPPAKPDREELASIGPESADDDGHTLIGGWQRPGIPFVRPPAVEAPRAAVRVPAPPAELGPPREPARIEPVVTKPALADGDVAAVQGAAPSFEPSTFGDLLDATLRL